jgi:hypothetical protein
MTPVILAVSSAIVRFLIAEIKQSATGESSALIGEAIKQVFKKFRLQAKVVFELLWSGLLVAVLFVLFTWGGGTHFDL